MSTQDWVLVQLGTVWEMTPLRPGKWVGKRRNSDSVGTYRVRGGIGGLAWVSGLQQVHLHYPRVSPARLGSQEGRSEWEALTSCGMMALSAEKRGFLTCRGWGIL